MTETPISAAEYRRLAQSKRDEAQSIIDAYGQGVRPSWVSADLAIAYDWAARYDTAANNIEAETNNVQGVLK